MAGGESSRLRELFAGARGRLLAALLLAEFAASVTGLSYSAVLPVAAAELSGLEFYGAAVTATGIVGIAFLGFGAYLYGRIGAQAQLLISTIVLVAGVVMSATATTMWVLVGGLALRGVAAGLMGGLGMGVISEVYPDAKQRERVFGLYAIMWIAPALVGPAINGVLLVAWGWRATMVWPAVLVLIARGLMAGSLRVVGWQRPAIAPKVRGPWAFVAIAAGLAAAQVYVASATVWGVAAGVVLMIVVLVVPFRHALVLTVPAERRAQAGSWVLALVCGSYFGINAFVPLLSAEYIDASGVVGAVLVSLGPLTWGLISATGWGAHVSERGAYRLAAIVFPVAAALVALGAMLHAGVGHAVGLGIVTVLIGAAMGIVYPKVMALTFKGFRAENGTNRAHGGVVLGLGEDVGTAVGVTVLAGIGALIVSTGPVDVAVLAAMFAVLLVIGWGVSSRSTLWGSRAAG